MTIPATGLYKIKNVAFDTQYADMTNGSSEPGTAVAGHYEDNTVTGTGHRTFELVLKDQINHLVTLMNKTSGTYATINEDKMVVEGGESEQEFQLLDLGNGQFIIHLQDEDASWILPKADDWTQITIGATPDKTTNPEGYKEACWTFEQVAA
ncbi:hypothetical protein K503DRAFT_804695 [Rhizopogon vinicolor AM-OR11-026]|uniref:Uncharacterized protein n=1 Tax=Rhizopogon vinicolor AM-OR11-026 TaxID=1314800 RepID=A0A1B7MKE5_9AGAM|nr:hypothetical protein K503DRAFT_804695 [Rhizopogon vinicolor AM-OR11-026]